MSSFEGMEAPVNEEVSLAVSAYDDDNFAEVTRCIWVSEVEVAVDVLLTLNPGITAEAQSDPWQSQLVWDGGGRAWPCYVIEQEPPSKEEKGEEEVADLALEGTRRLSRTHLRSIIFRPVSLSKAFNFRYGGNFTFINVRSGAVPQVKFKKEEELEDLTPVDRNLITIRELNYLLADNGFARSLDLINLRPDQALMVYQKLNLTNTERVKVHDFIEAIMRMKRPVQGLDVAVAKSLMRRLILEVEDLATNCVRCQDCFRGVSEKLREVEVLDSADAMEVGTTESRMSVISNKSMQSTKSTASEVPEAPPEADQRAKKYCDDLLRRNRALEVKIASMKAFIQHAREQQAKEEEDDGMGPGHSFANVSGFGKDDGAVPRDSARSGARGSWAEAPAVRRSLAELPRPRSCSPGWD